MDEKGSESAGDCGDCRHSYGFRGDDSVELVGAGRIRIPSSHILASARHIDFEQAAVWRLPSAARLGWTLEDADERSLAANDSGGTGEVPPGYVEPLWQRVTGGIA